MIGEVRLKKGVIKVSQESQDSIFTLSRNDVIACARDMGIPDEEITDDVLEQVKKGVEWGLDCWVDVVKEAINLALKG